MPRRTGFTLIEVLASLGLCALLATAVAAAVSFSARAERSAARAGEASLLLPSLYVAQRLRPAELPVAPPGWRVVHSTEIVQLADDLRQEWHRLDVADADHEIPAFPLLVLDDAP